MSQLFSVIDIETTGGLATKEKITEIAIYVTDGNSIIEEFSTLINPERRIPSFITGLTGITNEMVEDAPKFYEVAAKIVELTKNTVFVAHNASFDYSFVKNEFSQLGYNFKLNTLCTLQLSRKLFKGHKSYSLGNLCNDLGIVIHNRHRAGGDAQATAILFKMLYEFDLNQNEGININGFSICGLNPTLKLSKISNLPEKAGVYYLYDSNNDLIYIGKSKNIHSRVLSHLRNEKTNKGINLKFSICDIDYEQTGSELIALLKESHEIKKHKPTFNKAQRRTSNNWGIYSYEDELGYIRFKIQNVEDSEEAFLNAFSSKLATQDALTNYCIKYQLCQKLCGLYQSAGACFYYGLGECKGACCGAESPEDYNLRANALISEFSPNLQNVLIVLNDCDDDRIGLVAIKNSKYIGYGYTSQDAQLSVEDMLDCISHFPENKDVRQIIRTYLKTHRDYKVVEF
jgi:DNA polymerase-3 subunit epsilon